jgi:hypothetical protein
MTEMNSPTVTKGTSPDVPKVASALLFWVAASGLTVAMIPTALVLWTATKPMFWKTVPCTILSSQIVTNFFVPYCALDTGVPRASVEFAYKVDDNESFTSTRMHNLGFTFQTETTAQFPSGSNRNCYVNPFDHSRAVLMRYPPLDELLAEIAYEYETRNAYLYVATISIFICVVARALGRMGGQERIRGNRLPRTGE